MAEGFASDPLQKMLHEMADAKADAHRLSPEARTRIRDRLFESTGIYESLGKTVVYEAEQFLKNS